MNCPNCGALIREHASFCTSCGTRVSRPPRLKSTMPLGDTPPVEPAPAVPDRTQIPPVEPVTAPPQPAEAPSEPAAPASTARTRFEPSPGERVRSVYDVVERSARPDAGPVPMPEPEEKLPSRASVVLHHIRAYLAVALAVFSLVLLFFPWFSTGMEVAVDDVKINGERYDLLFGDVDVRDNTSRGTYLSILDVVQFREVTDLVDLHLENKDAREAMKDSGKTADQRIREYLSVPGEVALSDSFRLPTGVVAMAPQLLCILLMFIFFIIGVIRVFAAEALPSGAPKTGWLKAGGIVGLVMTALTGAEVFVINQFQDRIVDALQSKGFDGSIDLSVKLILGYILFALVSVLLVLAASRWDGRKRRR